jgi:hypothetical protein
MKIDGQLQALTSDFLKKSNRLFWVKSARKISAWHLSNVNILMFKLDIFFQQLAESWQKNQHKK